MMDDAEKKLVKILRTIQQQATELIGLRIIKRHGPARRK